MGIFFPVVQVSKLRKRSSEVAKVLLKEREMYHYNETTEEGLETNIKNYFI